MSSVKIIGLNDLQADFAKLAKAQSRSVRRKATMAGARVIIRAARKRAPKRSGKLRRNIVAVPLKQKDGEGIAVAGRRVRTWDGMFKAAWTNNPAWVYYGLLLDKLNGLGDRVDASMVDKWALYAIARYCDELVSDGKGGKEPRFTCNCVLQTRADAFKVVQDLASVFRGISYWGAGSVVASADMPSDPVYLYTAANVVGGSFKYVGSERKTRYTVALVSYNDPTNQYKQAVEPVQDDDGIARYGVIKTEVTAFGCTSQAQAHRLGRWLLLTSRYETGTVSFQVGLDGTLCAPGQVIAVADPKKAGRRIGGRIRAAAGERITLDKAPTIAAGDRFTAILPSGIAQARAVKSVDGDTVTLAERFDADPVAGAVWMIESRELAAQQYRVVSVQESDDDGQIVYTINATQYEPGKYAAIDDGAQIQQRPITIVPPSVQPPPSNVRLSTYSVVDQGISKTTMVIAWDAANHATSYVVEWRKDNGEWVKVNDNAAAVQTVAQSYAEGAHGFRCTSDRVVRAGQSCSNGRRERKCRSEDATDCIGSSLRRHREFGEVRDDHHDALWSGKDGSSRVQTCWWCAPDGRTYGGRLQFTGCSDTRCVHGGHSRSARRAISDRGRHDR
ncbi:gp20 [Burkholderia pseudomallei]|nr:gp20 [Burkholderia pseudomallei]